VHSGADEAALGFHTAVAIVRLVNRMGTVAVRVMMVVAMMARHPVLQSVGQGRTVSGNERYQCAENATITRHHASFTLYTCCIVTQTGLPFLRLLST
jgi:hypothetical protein